MAATKKCPTATSPSDQPKVCCVYVYNGNGTPLDGQRQCIAIDDAGSAGSVTSAECLATVVYHTATNVDVPVPYGFISECCYDCNSNKPALIITTSGKLIRTGTELNTSTRSIFDRCCCNDGDDCACTPVPDCEQVRCAHRPDLSAEERCTGRCTSYRYTEDLFADPPAFTENTDERQVTCQSKPDCCGESGADCTSTCSDGRSKDGPILGRAATNVPVKKSWETMPCAGCGVCCVIVYGTDPTKPDYGVKIRNGAGRILDADGKPLTQATCEEKYRLIDGDDTSPLVAYGEWHPGETDVNICNPLCCKTVAYGDRSDAECAHMENGNTTCDPCLGKCIDLVAEHDPAKCARVTCATRVECCGENDINCKPDCGRDAFARWAPPTCPTDNTAGDSCGVCCTIVYDANGVATDERTCDDGEALNTRSKCEAANTAGKPIGEWHPFLTCADNPCNTKICCKQINPGDPGATCDKSVAECKRVPKDEVCGCQGICTQLTGDKKGETTCQDKKSCCGGNGAKCRPGCHGEPADFAWRDCGEPTCGVCCKNQPNGDVTCDAALTKKECETVNNGAPVGTWYAYGTCGDVPCAKHVKCCDDTVGNGCQAGIIRCLDLPVAECDNPCRNECYPIDATGAKSDDSFCATKVDCCGPANQNCVALPGICPDTNTVPTHNWVNSCANPDICGVCCQPNAVGDARCDTAIDNKTDCQAANGSWVSFGTCVDCGVQKNACIEAKCLIKGENVTVASCRPVPPDTATSCKGVCTELATGFTTCKTKSGCCGADGAKCDGGGCGGTVTHSFSNTCLDPEQCGVCCIVTDIGRGPEPGPPEENIGRAACEAKGNAHGGLGVTATWIPLGTTKNCTGKPCATLCPDKSVVCVTITPPGVCPADPCAGKCIESDGTVSVKTKADCCVQDGVNLCNAPADDRCPPRPKWDAVCDDNSLKCGAVCKTIMNGGTILSSACEPAITTYADMLLAQAAAPPGISYTWNPWETCDTLICRSKKCCKDICPDVKGCATVDYTDECKKCSGLCYDAIVTVDALGNSIYNIDPEGNVECLPRSECCGVGNEKCSAIPNCPDQPTKVFVPCGDETECPSGACRCNSANYDANDFNFFSDTWEADAPVQIAEQCSSSLWMVGAGIARENSFMTSIEDPCFNNCPPPNDPTDEAAYNDYELCIMREEAQITYPFEWKPCYPGILGNATLYMYTEFCSWLRWDHRFSGQYYTDSTASAGGFYLCDGEKLVNVTDTILTKNKIKLCQTSYFSIQNVSVDSERTNVEIDPFDWGQCIKYTIGKTDDGKATFKSEYTLKPCMGTFKTVCDAYNPPKADIKAPDMICPPAFTMNPLP